MTASLTDHLNRLITENGPISIGRYMAEALGHPSLGYYIRKDPFGAAGDFVTAPEISQMFGELIGLWCAEVWRLMGRPNPVLMVELGPGRGTLMADVLRAARVVPAFASAVRLHLIETSPCLREAQRTCIGRDCVWHAEFETVPRGPMLLIANEFFDALPVRQFVQTKEGWRERRVDRATDGTGFRFVLATEPMQDEDIIPPVLRSSPPGTLVEIAAERTRLTASIAKRLSAESGAALILDYGPSRTGPGETLQAVRDHACADPLAEPGKADLTAHVDFEALGQAALAAGAAVSGPIEQGQFLGRLGIRERAQVLSTSRPDQSAALAVALHRLTSSAQMGQLFKVLALRNRALPSPPGFRSDELAF